MIEGYSKLIILLECENFRSSIMEILYSKQHADFLQLVFQDGYEIVNSRIILNREKCIGPIPKENIIHKDGDIYIKNDYIKYQLPDEIKVYAIGYGLKNVIDNKVIKKCENLLGFELSYDNEISIKCRYCGKNLKRNEQHTFEPNNIQSRDIKGNRICWSNITGYTDNIHLALQANETLNLSMSDMVDKYRLNDIEKEDLLSYMKTFINNMKNGEKIKC